MANYTNYTEKTEPVDTDLVLIYDTPAKVNKKFTFGNLWKWIAKKIVSEGISQLETTNKTIPGAINELNSKIYIYSGETRDKAQTISFQFQQDAHMTGILYIDYNMYISIFAFGRKSGVANILNSAGAVPSLNSHDNTVSVNLTIWGNCKLITMDRNVKVIGSL
mgnify:CR=1 FL=1